MTGDGFPYGYRKITVTLKEDYNLIINHKKVYRLCNELKILRDKPKMYPNRPRQPVQKIKVDAPNQLWQMDLKYGYIANQNRFFFMISVIDVFDRMIIDYHVGLTATARDSSRLVKNALEKRGLYHQKPIIRTDNGPQFTAKRFIKTMDAYRINHERIPVETPNLNAYIEAFHSILEDECFIRHEFENFSQVYDVIQKYIDYYNNRRRHGSLNYKTPAKYHLQNIEGSNQQVA